MISVGLTPPIAGSAGKSSYQGLSVMYTIALPTVVSYFR
jgi:hypothetical protein